ncbi:hypothetical protein ACI3QN_01750 [Propionibacterium freudenreichii]|uniref:LpxL/LpxP family acyltransferase n=1 Tax=Propionibacterium freudenreichii TaxID=1744 RepID=UPI0038535AB8
MSRHHRHSNLLPMMRIGSHLPAWFWRPVGRLVVAFLTTFPPRHMRQWQLNYAVMTGHRPSWNTTRRAFGRWVENMMCSLQLDRWSEKKIRSRVILENPEGWAGVHRAFQEGGLVAALPHMGSWDLVGAFACLDGLPVSSVAEALPDGQFEYFRSLRERLGFRIFSLRYRGVYNKLADDLDEGRVICLVADRDFSRRGLPVHWDTPDGPRDQTMPPGPALLAQQGHRPLVGVVTWFGPRHRLHVLVTDLIHVGSGEQELVRASQQLADFFSRQISDHPLDWLMLQRFFRGVTA